MATASSQSGASTRSILVDQLTFLPGTSGSMRALQEMIENVAATRVPVLIVGESGSGKRAVACRIHQLSTQHSEPLHEVVCAEISSDFFGSGNGSKLTTLASATLLLTEIGDLSASSQSKMWHSLAESERNAESRGPRILASTRRNLDQEIRSSRFREDLYYRISGVCLRVPPLRHRKEDIPLLIDFFLNKYSTLFGRPKSVLSSSTLRFLSEYSWPDNVRELEDAVKTIAAIGDERVAIAAMRSAFFDGRRRNGETESISLKEAGRAASRQAERELILKVLSRTRWNRKRAAEELRISYKALLYKLKQFGVDEYANPNRGED